MLFHATAILGLAALLTHAAPGTGVVQARQGDQWVGNIDVGKACDEQYGAAQAYTVGNSCWDWRCGKDGLEFPVNMEAYCDKHYGNSAFSACGGGTVWDWQCRRG